MIRRIGRGGQGLFLVLAFAVRAAAQYDQDLYISNYDLDSPERVIVSGYPTLNAMSSTLMSGPMDSTSAYLVLYDAANGVVASCPVMSGDTVTIPVSGGVQITVTIDQKLKVVTTVPFSPESENTGYMAWTLGENYQSASTFAVNDGSSHAKCQDLGTSYAGKLLRITTESVPSVRGDRDHRYPGDVPIPIIGNSLKFFAPVAIQPSDKAAFSCGGTQSCTIEGIGVTSLEVTHPRAPRIEQYLNLLGISGWRITVYPQQLEITPSFWGKSLKFTLPASSSFKLARASGGSSLKVVNSDGSDTRPQQFVIDWSPGWFGTHRYLPVPCVQCTLNLETR